MSGCVEKTLNELRGKEFGYWVKRSDGWFTYYECSICHGKQYEKSDVCGLCGNKTLESKGRYELVLGLMEASDRHKNVQPNK